MPLEIKEDCFTNAGAVHTRLFLGISFNGSGDCDEATRIMHFSKFPRIKRMHHFNLNEEAKEIPYAHIKSLHQCNSIYIAEVCGSFTSLVKDTSLSMLERLKKDKILNAFFPGYSFFKKSDFHISLDGGRSFSLSDSSRLKSLRLVNDKFALAVKNGKIRKIPIENLVKDGSRLGFSWGDDFGRSAVFLGKVNVKKGHIPVTFSDGSSLMLDLETGRRKTGYISLPKGNGAYSLGEIVSGVSALVKRDGKGDKLTLLPIS